MTVPQQELIASLVDLTRTVQSSDEAYSVHSKMLDFQLVTSFKDQMGHAQ